MSSLKFTVIKNRKQYDKYCSILEKLLLTKNKTSNDEIELLTILIDKWDREHTSFDDISPVELIKSLMENNDLKAKDLADILELSKGTVSKILNLQKGLSKESIRKLSKHFNIAQEAFNRPYKLLTQRKDKFKSIHQLKPRKIGRKTRA